MNPDNHFNLPPPIAEVPPPKPAEVGEVAADGEQLMVASPEAAAGRPSMPKPAASQQDDTQVLQALDDTSLQPGAAAALQAAQAASADDAIADREWVLRAKQIVNQTLQDPYEQNRQLATVKADYLQKRYGKTVKLAE